MVKTEELLLGLGIAGVAVGLAFFLLKPKEEISAEIVSVEVV